MKYFVSLFILIATLATLVIVLMKNQSRTTQTTTRPNEPIVLSDYFDSDVKVRVTMDGDVRAKENQRSVRITVGRGIRQVEVFKGFERDLERSKTYDNTQADFEVFAKSIQGLGFTFPSKDKNQLEDETGICPFGVRYIYEVIEDDRQVMRLWSNTCAPEIGTFKGAGTPIRQLFRQQIPDYAAQTQGVLLVQAQ